MKKKPLKEFTQNGGKWYLQDMPIKVYDYDDIYTFYENDLFDDGNGDKMCRFDHYNTEKHLVSCGIGICVEWFHQWLKLGCKRQGVPRHIKQMIWVQDWDSLSPVPFELVSCEKLILWDISARESLYNCSRYKIEGMWTYESPEIILSKKEIEVATEIVSQEIKEDKENWLACGSSEKSYYEMYPLLKNLSL